MPNSWIADLARPLAVACNDAGAANIILEGIRDCDAGVRVVAGGPALAKAQLLPAVSLYDDIAAALDGANTLLSGTGWASDLEHNARRYAARNGIRSIGVIDHWVNYRERFSRNDEEILPDEIWVTDSYALDIAQSTFPGRLIRQVPNLFMQKALSRMGDVDGAGDVLLYVLEPARSDWGRGRPGEFQALDYFFDLLPQLDLPSGLSIVLRPHPSDPVGKYDSWLAGRPGLPARIETDGDIDAAIGSARWVAGCESFALVLALASERQVFCTLPPWAPACRLPHAGLHHLKLEYRAP